MGRTGNGGVYRRKFCKAFILHLARAEQRVPNVHRLVSEISNNFLVETEVFAATDFHELDQNIDTGYRENIFSPKYPFQLRPAEIAIFLSYRSLMKTIAGLEDGFYLIIEDDAAIDLAKFSRLVSDLNQSADFDFVRCPIKKRDIRNPFARSKEELYRPVRIGAGMVAQFVTPKAAHTIYTATEKFDRPIDGFMQLAWRHKLSVGAYDNSGVSEISENLGGTLAHSRLPFREAIRKEVKRMVYRSKVFLHSVAWAVR